MSNKKIENLVENDRFNSLRNYMSFNGFLYLRNKFNDLKIEILSNPASDLFSLSETGKLEEWCWETTETAILFMNDNDYIERGYLTIDENEEEYYHSWICFRFLGTEYTYDPCFDILCKKEKYNQAFKAKVISKITAKKAKDYFINYMENPPKISEEKQELYNSADQVFKTLLGEHAFDKCENEMIIPNIDDINSPMFRNGVGYKADISNGKIKQLVAHYYK